MRYLPRSMQRRRSRRDSGSILVEFLLVFPAFLILAMFVLEIGLMWSDRHIIRLATFEAARVYATANLPEWDGHGHRFDNPCTAPEATKHARQAALRKLAIVSPPLQLVLAKLGGAAAQLSFGSGAGADDDGGAPTVARAFRRLSKRWPTAVVSTELACDWDPATTRVHVHLRYHRLLQTPIVDRVMFFVYQLARAPGGGGASASLDSDFFGVDAAALGPAARAQVQLALTNSLAQIRTLQMPLDQAAGYLSGVPGIDALVAAIPGPALDLQTPLDATRLATSAGLATTSGPRATASQQAALLTALVASVPSALWRIPIDIDVSLQRQAFSVHADGGVALREPRWLGHMWGVLNLEGSLREWGQSLSVDHAEISTDSKPLQDL